MSMTRELRLGRKERIAKVILKVTFVFFLGFTFVHPDFFFIYVCATFFCGNPRMIIKRTCMTESLVMYVQAVWSRVG